MAQVIAFPGKYVQGYGELSHISKYVAVLGKAVLIIASQGRLNELQGIIQDSFKDTDIAVAYEAFGGECSKREVERLRAFAKSYQSKVIVGMGGGKVIDTAKAVAHYEQLPVVIIPTVASSDAPTSAIAVFYNEDGSFQEVLSTGRNPSVVLMDTSIIANSPARLLVAGMGDALATYFEARTCVESYRQNYAGGIFTLASYALAKLCYETLLADGFAAKLAIQNKTVTKALANVIEANTLLSGIGFESNGIAVAHAVYNGFTIMPNAHALYHGEWVAFGTLVQLILENRPRQELEEVLRFCLSVGLPTTLADCGMDNISREQLLAVAQAITAPKRSVHNEPFPVTDQDVLAAILVADATGQMYKGKS
ncbi:glycerol dehydrogenase [Sporomusa termitida]|uniref:Glycerol dehydrogenase n=1 Tax=Sporomusa termitida TaxID=2377 RepID=A0A517DWU1_9FIRM|nr:glycerol dehydrogenase [Sporomusa termitida]QDR81825.1 Glycerol dehydrogenase [Sporomusa termitida]